MQTPRGVPCRLTFFAFFFFGSFFRQPRVMNYSCHSGGNHQGTRFKKTWQKQVHTQRGPNAPNTIDEGEESYHKQDRGETALDYACPSWAGWRGDRIYFEIFFFTRESFQENTHQMTDYTDGCGAPVAAPKNPLHVPIMHHLMCALFGWRRDSGPTSSMT